MTTSSKTNMKNNKKIEKQIIKDISYSPSLDGFPLPIVSNKEIEQTFANFGRKLTDLNDKQ